MRCIFVRQDGNKDCGVSCLLMIIRTHKGGCSKEYLRDITNTTKDGTSAYDLVKAAEKFNFTSFGLRGRIKDVKKEYFPVIAHVIKDNKYQHFVVIYKMLDNGYLLVADPASSGIRKVKIEEFEKISTNQYIVCIPKGKILNIKRNYKFYKILSSFFRIHTPTILLVFTLSLLFTISSIFSTFYLQFLMNKLLPNNWHKSYIFIPLIFLFIQIFRIICQFLRNSVLVKFIHKFDYYLLENIYSHLFLLPDSYYENRTTGEVVARITDLENIKSMISNILLDGLTSILLMLISLVILLYIDYILTMILCISAVIIILLSLLFKRKIRLMIATLKEESSKIYSYLTDTIKEIISIKHLNCKDFFVERFRYKHFNYLKIHEKYEKYCNLEICFKDLIFGILNIFIVGLGYYCVLLEKLDLSSFIVYLFLYPYLLEPFNKLFDFYINIEDTKESLNRVYEFYQVEDKVNESDLEEGVIFNHLLLKDINYQYRRDNMILNNLNFELNMGDRVLIYGKSGSGKTTLIKIIAGYLNDYKGSIFVNGLVDNGVVDFLRKRVSYIRQGDSLLNMSLRDNIILGRDISDEEFMDVCKLLKIDEFAFKNVLKYDMQIGEEGENLSAGERQRVLLARGILKQGDIYIFDESLSNLDVKLEREILENILAFLNNKTVIVVSHRFYNEDLFQRKIELKEGGVYG